MTVEYIKHGWIETTKKHGMKMMFWSEDILFEVPKDALKENNSGGGEGDKTPEVKQREEEK